jgi:hypothetical protein
MYAPMSHVAGCVFVVTVGIPVLQFALNIPTAFVKVAPVFQHELPDCREKSKFTMSVINGLVVMLLVFVKVPPF